MAGQKLTEKQVAALLKNSASLIISQPEGEAGSEVESIRRLQVAALISGLKSMGLLDELEADVEALDGAVNGSGGTPPTAVPLDFEWVDGSYIEASTGKRYTRDTCSWSDFIAIPAGVTKLTLKASGNLNANGYCFYTQANISYPVANSGGRMRDGSNIVELEVDVPDTATYVAFSTVTADKASSGAWYMTAAEPGTPGILDKLDGIAEALSPCTDRAGEIAWTDGKRIIRIYGMYDTSGYKIGQFHAAKGDRIVIDHQTALPKSVVQIAQEVTLASGTAYRPLMPEISVAHVEYVCTEEMDLVISVKTADLLSVKWLPMPVLGDVTGMRKRQGVLFPFDKVGALMRASAAAPMYKGNTMQRPLVLVHISDIHNSRVNAEGFKEFLDYFGGYVDDAIITGDMAGSRYTDYVPVYSQAGFNRILLAIGNHDVYDHNGDAPSADYDDREYFATELETYTKYIAPSVANWNVTQPTNAATNDYCYYYKDYNLGNDKGIRLIVLDAIHYNAAQHAWLVNTLAAARTAELPVVIAEHFIPIETTSPDDAAQFDTAFASMMPGLRDLYGLYFLSYVDGGARYKAADAVDSFITSGGEFVCWLCGHMHFDMVGTLLSHPNQVYIAVGTASAASNNAYQDMPREFGAESESLINVVSVDTYNKTVRVARVGAVYDDHMRHRGTMCIDYANRRLVRENAAPRIAYSNGGLDITTH